MLQSVTHLLATGEQPGAHGPHPLAVRHEAVAVAGRDGLDGRQAHDLDGHHAARPAQEQDV